MEALTATDPVSAPAETPRQAARRRVYGLIRTAQLDGGLTTEIVSGLVAEAERNGWEDVVKLGLYLAIFCERYVERGTGRTQIEALLVRAIADDDPVMTALALAARAQVLELGPGRAAVDADRDLARATALLEGWSGPSSEAVSAHIEAAYAYECRDLWELQLRHYAAAENCLDAAEGAEERRQVLLYNRAETELKWLVALRERGRDVDLAERGDSARRTLDRALAAEMPAAWHDDLLAFRELVDAVAPPAGGPSGPSPKAGGRHPGHLRLARALRTDDPAAAFAESVAALDLIDPIDNRHVHQFALALAVELESAVAGHETAGLRWGRELVDRRWERRLAALASVESLLDVERREAEHALLRQHAYLDDLTGLANRRALHRFVEGRVTAGALAVALFDLDSFKEINDGHGHAVGDEVLIRLATILRSGVREDNLVARLGGDEFLLVFTPHDLDAAARRCATLIDAVADGGWAELAPDLRVTMSVGVARGPAADFEAVLATADAALYSAKRAGGARLAVASAPITVR